MIKIHFDDGRTVPLDLNDEAEATRWLKAFASSTFQDSIRGATIYGRHARVNGSFSVQDSVPRPESFQSVWYESEIVENRGKQVGERIVVFADDVRLTVTSFLSQAATRIELSKIGRRRIRT